MKITCIASDPAIDKFLSPLNDLGTVEIHHKQDLAPQEVINLCQDSEVLITGPESVGTLSKEILSQLPKLKFISLLTVGTGWVDLEAAKSQGILVSNIKGTTAESVAEHIWAMILDLAKRVNEFDRATRIDGEYNFANFKGKEVYGKTFGIIGLGNIGKRVARIGEAFSMKILGVHTTMDMVEGIEVVDKEALLKGSDVIALCLPLNEQTKDYISNKEFEMMKEGVILVNCSREELVQKEALMDAFKQEKIFGYGVETTILKEVPHDDPYYQYPNIIVTAHNAFNTVEADERSYQLVVENVIKFAKGNPQNLVME